MNLFDLTGRKGLVTGASRGLGRGLGTGLLKAGAEVVFVDILDGVEETVSTLRAQGMKAHALKADLSNRADRDAAFRAALDLLGGELDILVNNAGMHDRRACLDMPLESWDKVIELNITSVFHLCKLAGEVMVPRGRGKIINLASMLSFIGGFNASAYAVSKGGVAQLTKSLSNEWAGRGVCVNAIAPGYMDTNMNEDLKQNAARYEQVNARIPAGRWGTPEDLEGIAVFLASDASNYITGTVIPVDGGYIAR